MFPFIRVFRVFPFLRSLRAISLFRLTLIANRGAAALNDIFRRRHLQYVLSLSGLVASLAAVGTYYFERGVPGTAFLSFGDAVWWAASMVTTINTSIDPITFEGRVIGLLLRAYAMAVFGYVAASIASYLIGQESTEKESIENDERRAEREAIDRLSHEVERLSAMLDHQLPIEESSLESEQEEKQ